MELYNIASSYSDISIYETGREECRSDKNIVNAAKPYHLFHYIYKGKGTIEIEGKIYNLSKGTIFYIPNDYSARYYPNTDEPWSYEWIGFGGSVVDKILSALGVSSQNPIICNVGQNVKRYFDDVYIQYRNKGYLDIKCLGLVYELLSELLDNGKKNVNENLSSKEVLVHLAKEFIQNNYQFEIKVTDVANNVDTTPNYLSNCFEAVEHMSTKSYITKVRMDIAAVLLRDSDKKVNEVASLVGYKNQLHFSKEFKKYHGVNPLGFKKEEL